MNRGYFITFEGIDGSGKSTQIELLREWLCEQGYEVITTREPGGTAIGEKIREIILNPKYSDMDDITEAYLYASSRAQLVRETILPSVASGKIVICDRFLDSSIAYQGYGRQMGDKVKIINSIAVEDCMPDLTVYLKVEPDDGQERINDRELDRIELEGSNFRQRTFEGYENIAASDDTRVTVINGKDSIANIHEQIVNKVCNLISDR